MQDKIRKFKLHTPSWILTGAVCILIFIVGIMTFQAINRQKQESIRFLTEKGKALISSFEAGTKTGMIQMGLRGMLQKLLTSTAQQPDIDYILVSDIHGNIIAHSDPRKIGRHQRFDAKKIDHDKLNTRIVSKLLDKKIFEVFRKFRPKLIPHHKMFRQCFRPRDLLRPPRDLFKPPPHDRIRIYKSDLSDDSPLIIFVGLNMNSRESARNAEVRHIIVAGITMFLAGFAGIVLLYVVQIYRSSISRIKAFSDTLVENMPIGLIAFDTETKIASLNNLAEIVFNIKADETVGKYAKDVLPEDINNELQKVIARQEKIEKEIDCLISDKTRVPLEISGSLLEDRNEVLGYVFLFKDLSEIRSLRQKIAKNQQLASIGRLAAGVAHEVRNPLSSIKGFATYFRERYIDVPEDHKIAAIMIQETDRLDRVVSQLLEFTRPVSVLKRPVSVGKILYSALEVIRHTAAENKIKIKAEISDSDLMAELDPDRMKQVFLNLFLNSIEAMNHSGNLCVSLLKTREKNWCEIRVSDTGTGIEKKYVADIFDPYFTTKSSGTGLGLAIVHNTLAAHGGRIEVETKQAQGTTVSLFLPLIKKRAADELSGKKSPNHDSSSFKS